jgi:Sec-independent protein translocase protein TatA
VEGAWFYGAYVEGAWFGKALVEGEKSRSLCCTYGLTVEQLKFAVDGEQAELDEEFQRKLKAAKEKENTAEPPSGKHQEKGHPADAEWPFS